MRLGVALIMTRLTISIVVSDARASSPAAIDSIQPAGAATLQVPRASTSIAGSQASRQATDRS
jgi:hypothetical protein